MDENVSQQQQPRPELAYRWVGEGRAGEAATFTVVTGASVDEVLTAFGADPTQPVSLDDCAGQSGIEPWVAVTEVPGAVVAVEYNGWQGAQDPVLRAASASGLAASMYWNVNALTRLSFARAGVVLDGFEVLFEHESPDPDVRAALAGIDFSEFGHMPENGLVAVERFTGVGVRAEDVERIDTADVAYWILPLLPEMYAEERLADGSRRWPGSGPLGADGDQLALRDAAELSELAWWAAAEAVARADLRNHPAVAASLEARALSAEAQVLARRSGLEGGSHHWVWMALHEATNPDPLGAALHVIQSAAYVFGADTDAFLERVRAKLTARA